MAAQQVTPELRQWIIAQAQAGHRPETVLESMRASGWNEDVAIGALEEVLKGFLDDHARASGLPAPVPVPEADLRDSPSSVWAGDREVQIVFALRNPRVIVFGSLLSDDECDELIALAKPKLVRSETVITSTGGSEVNAARTSEGMFFERGENPLVRRIEERIAHLVNWPLENGEGLQILHYQPGAEYKPHHDYFDPVHSGTPTILKRGRSARGHARDVPEHPGEGRRHHLPGRAPGGGTDQGQRRVLQLRPRAPGDAHAAWRSARGGRREVGRDEVVARGPVRLAPTRSVQRLWRGSGGSRRLLTMRCHLRCSHVCGPSSGHSPIIGASSDFGRRV